MINYAFKQVKNGLARLAIISKGHYGRVQLSTLLFLTKAARTFPSARPMIRGPWDGHAKQVTAEV